MQSQVRFNRVPEKVPGEFARLWSSQVMFNRVPEKVPEKVGRFWCSQVMFNRVPEKVLGEVLGGFGAEPGHVQPGSAEGSWRIFR